jgi:hypothetical protein
MLVHGDLRIGIPLCGLSVGRCRTCDLVLDNPEVSRRHARFAPIQGRPWVFDLGSSNGVVVEGESASRRALDEGDKIWLGPEGFRIDRGEAPHPLHSLWERLPDEPSAALLALSCARGLSWGPGRVPVLEWESDEGDLGPLRTALLDSLLAVP